jgi:ribosomal protein L7/L12
MSVVELRCQSCHAPVDAAHAGVQKCKYCGAALFIPSSDLAAAPVGSLPTKEVHVVTLLRVGPSNRASMTTLLRTLVGIDEATAADLVSRAPCEITVCDRYDLAMHIKEEILAAGAGCEVALRVVPLTVAPLLPDVRLWLESSGTNKMAVIRAVREHMDVALADARHLVESAPCVLVAALEGNRANAFCDALIAAGATARTE